MTINAKNIRDLYMLTKDLSALSVRSKSIKVDLIDLQKQTDSVEDFMKESNKYCVLDIDRNVQEEVLIELFDSLKANKVLRILTLFHPESFTSKGAKALAGLLKVNTSLTSLCIWESNIEDEGLEYIAEALKMNTSLVKLDLGWNNITSRGAIAIAKALKVNESLVDLTMQCEDIGNEGFITLAEALKVNKSLRLLSIEGNYLLKKIGALALVDAMKINSSFELVVEFERCLDEEVREVFENYLCDVVKRNIIDVTQCLNEKQRDIFNIKIKFEAK